MDMRSGALSYGAAERHLLLGANIEMAEHFGLPYHSPAGSVDSWFPDVHAGAEKMQCWMARRAKQMIWAVGLGSLYNGLATSLEQVLIDLDLWKQADRVFQGLDTSELESAFEIIRRVGPSGSFLDDEQTLRLMRSGQVFISDLVNRDGDHGRSMLERAHEKVLQTLATHDYAAPEGVVQDIRTYVSAKANELTDGRA
jgi:trimethylamine--corrinoid protein Co-methyltransferase